MKSRKVKLADVLWEAANVRLSPVETSWYGDAAAVTATCCAAYWAERGHEWWEGGRHRNWQGAAKHSKAVQFLKSLGCKVGSNASFSNYQEGAQRQGVRYMWLLLAMHVAEDEDIEIEVSA